jgi:glucosamine 6-phosphate synthetase-like amidotransferase/phosphosugar isomerase protein
MIKRRIKDFTQSIIFSFLLRIIILSKKSKKKRHMYHFRKNLDKIKQNLDQENQTGWIICKIHKNTLKRNRHVLTSCHIIS